MTTPVLPIPKNATEMEEMLNDPTRSKDILASKDALRDWVQAYANGQQAPGTDLQRLVTEEVERQTAALARQDPELGGAIRRLNLDPQTRPANMLTSHRQGAAYNPAGPGVQVDAMFRTGAEFAKAVWHHNNTPEAHEQRAKLDAIRNAFGSTVPADGGFLVPETLRANLLQIALEQSIVRPRATVLPMESARVPIPMIDSTTNAGSVFGGMIAYWGEEGASLTDSSMKFGRIELDAKKLTGLSAVPNELLADSLMSFAALIETKWPEAIAFFEDLGFFSGSGAGEPLGFLGNPATVVQTAQGGQGANTIVIENINRMYSRMLPASLARAVWFCSPDSWPQLAEMALAVGTGGAPVMFTNAAGPAPATIYGRPLIITEKCSQLGTQGDIVFADLSYYLVGDRQTMMVNSSTDFLFGSDKTTWRIIQRVDGRPWVLSPITPANGGPTLSPFVELNSTRT